MANKTRISKKISDPIKKYFFELVILALELTNLTNSLNNYDNRRNDYREI